MDGTDVVGADPWHRHRQTRIRYRRLDRPQRHPRPQALRCRLTPVRLRSTLMLSVFRRQPRLAPLRRFLRLWLLLQARLQARLLLPCQHPQRLQVHQPLV